MTICKYLMVQKCLSSEVDEVKCVILSLHPTCTELEVCSTYTKYSTIRIKGTVYGSHKSRVKNTSIVIGQLHSESLCSKDRVLC